MKKLAALVLFSLALAGCGGGGGDSGSPGPVNTAPVANAGTAQTVVTGGVVTLDGSASSDADGNTLTYTWTLARPVGSSATLSSATAQRPTFTADVAGTYTASLVVNDGTVSSSAATATVTAGGVLISSLVGSWAGITNSAASVTVNADITIAVAANTLTITTDQLIGTEGECSYTAPLNPAGDGVGSGTYTCDGAVSGTWQLLDLRRVDSNDRYVKMTRNDTETKTYYGMALTGLTTPRTPPAALSSLVGSYEGVAQSGSGETIPADPVTVAVAGSALTLTVTRFGELPCTYSGTIGADGVSVSAATYTCGGVSGAWSLLDLRSVGGGDIYASVLVGGEARRVYGLEK